jgi:hypothetical protein
MPRLRFAGVGIGLAATIVACAWACACACACHHDSAATGNEPAPAVSAVPGSAPAPAASAAEEAPVVHDDVEGLRAWIHLPRGVASCRWIAHTMGDGILGPSDYQVTAFVELTADGWAEVLGDAAALAPERDASPWKLHAKTEEARALLPASLVTALPAPEKGRVEVPSVPLPAESIVSASSLRVRQVWRVAGGLWISGITT